MPRRIVTDFEAIQQHPALKSATRDPDDDTITFQLAAADGQDQQHTVICTITDYPHGDTFWFHEQRQENGAMSGTLEGLVSFLEGKFCGGGASSSSSADQMPVRQDSSSSGMASQGGRMGTFSGDMFTDEAPLSEKLLRDIELAKQKFGYDVHIERVAIGVRLSWYVSVDHLINELTARAWGFSHGTPFKLELRFERPEYIESSRAPELFVTQNDAPCRFGAQIQNFLSLYIKNNWDSGHGWAPPAALVVRSNNEAASGNAAAVDSAASASAPPPPLTEVERLEMFIKELSPVKHDVFLGLCNMGFGEEQAAAAAFYTDSGAVNDALDRLTGDPANYPGQPLDVKQIIAKQSAAEASRAVTHGGGGDRGAGFWQRLTGLGGGGGGGGASPAPTTASDRNKLYSTSPQAWFESLKAGGRDKQGEDFDAAKTVPYDPVGEGWIVHLTKYLLLRVKTAHLFCVICDQRHLLAAGVSAMLRPCCCERQLCVYSFQNLGIGKDAADGIAAGGGTVDLLLLAFRLCCMSSRANDLLTFDMTKSRAYPSVADPDTGNLVFDPKRPDVAAVQRLVTQLPKSRELIGVESIEALSRTLEGKDKMLFPLLQWVISSNRSMLLKLDKANRLPSFSKNNLSFLIAQDAPEKAATFNGLKEKHGSTFAFHGSAACNLHNILRCGLIVASGTKMMTAGSAYGTGVYNANSAGMSLGYSRGNPGASSRKQGSDHEETYIDGTAAEGSIAVLFITEIIKSNHAKDHGWGYVVDNADHIAVRFVLVIADQEAYQQASGVDLKNEKSQAEVRALCDKLMA